MSVCYSGSNSWSLGEFNSQLSYYDGMLKLSYSNGSRYNNGQHTLRSTMISFLCDREAGAGKPEFQVLTGSCHVLLTELIQSLISSTSYGSPMQ